MAKFSVISSLGIVLLLGTACNQQPSSAGPPDVSNSFTELAPGFLYREYEGGVSIRQDFLNFDQSTVPAIQNKVSVLRGQVSGASEQLILASWERALAEATDAYAVLQSDSAKQFFKANQGQLSTQAFSCSNAATARDFSTGSGAKADASASCSGDAAWYTQAKTNARANGVLTRDSDSGGAFSRASSSKAGTYSCGSDAYARSDLVTSFGTKIPYGSKTDSHTGC